MSSLEKSLKQASVTDPESLHVAARELTRRGYGTVEKLHSPLQRFLCSPEVDHSFIEEWVKGFNSGEDPLKRKFLFEELSERPPPPEANSATKLAFLLMLEDAEHRVTAQATNPNFSAPIFLSLQELFKRTNPMSVDTTLIGFYLSLRDY